MQVELDVNGQTRTVDVEPRTSLLDCLRDKLLLTGAHAGCEHGVCGACTVLVDGAPVRSCLMFAVQADGYAITTIEGLSPGPGELSPFQDAFCETHGMQCGYCTPAMILAAHALLANNPAPTRDEIVDAISGNICRCTGYAQIVEAIALAAERMRGLNRPAEHAMSAPRRFRFVSSDRRVREDRRFVVGKGRFAADIALPGTRHVALVTCPHPAARIVSIDKARGAGDAGRALRARRRGARRRDQRRCWPASTRRTCRAVRSPSMSRAMPANGSRRWSRTRRALAEDAAERCAVDYEPLPFVLDGEEAYAPGSPLVHADARLQRAARPHLRLGRGREGFRRRARISCQHRVKWGRSSTVPVETFGVTASWDPWREMLDVCASIQMPKFPDQIALALKLPGSVGARALRRRRRRQLRRQARHQAHGAGRLSLAPARLPGAADRGPAGEHARRRRARAGAQLRYRGRVRRRTA